MLVSIITPTYNRENYLDKTINSILEQDYPNIEYLLVDDGSKDGTKDLIKKYFPRLKYFYHENIGESKTVNRGYQLSKGEIILIVNSDDPLYSTKIVTAAVEKFKKYPDAVAVYCDWVLIDDNDKELRYFKLPDYNIENMLIDFNVMLGPGMFIKRSALERIGWRNEEISYTGDLDISFKLAKSGKLIHLEMFGATHRLHDESLSSTAKGEKMALEVFDLAYKTFSDSVELPETCIENRFNILKHAAFTSSSFLSDKESSLDVFSRMFNKINNEFVKNLKSVLQIDQSDLINRRFGGYDLCKYLNEKGLKCSQIVWEKKSKNDYVSLIGDKFNKRENLKKKFDKLNHLFGTNALFYPFPFDLFFNEKFLNSDVVHLHLIHNYFFGIEHLPTISRIKPVVWSIHDPWVISGHCVHPLDCNRWIEGCWKCPDINRPFNIPFDSSALNWEYKKNIFQSCELDIIVSSKWMFDKLSKSCFFKNSKIHIVNFGIDLNIFKPINNEEFRKKLNIPVDNIVIAFRATNWMYKGLYYIKECLISITHVPKVTLLVFNEKGLLNEFRDTFQIVELGWISEDKQIVEAYNVADIFLMPSVAESFGMMAIESMACGKPVIVMDGTSLSEIVLSEESGSIIVKQGDISELSNQLQRLIDSKELRDNIGTLSRKTVLKHYDKDRYLTKILEVYKAAIERKKNDYRSAYIIEQQKENSLKYQKNLNSFKLIYKVLNNAQVQRILNNNLIKLYLHKTFVQFVKKFMLVN